jgi:hypothetical protein
MLVVAIALAVGFGLMGVAAWAMQQVFLAVMAFIGGLMTLWAAAGWVRRE